MDCAYMNPDRTQDSQQHSGYFEVCFLSTPRGTCAVIAGANNQEGNRRTSCFRMEVYNLPPDVQLHRESA